MAGQKRTVVVTGGGGGIGYACANRFMTAGDRVVILEVDPELGRRAEATLSQTGEAHFLATDVSDGDAVRAAIKHSYDIAGRLDVMVNCAGIVTKTPILETTEADFDRVIATNLKGTFICCQAAARLMVQQGSGAIVNLSSVTSVATLPDQVAYAASKGGVNQLTKTMAVALARSNVRVNAVAPGTVMTEMAKKAFGTTIDHDTIMSRTPLGRTGRPEEIASTVFFLASDEASYITGEIIYVDGGRLALLYTMPPVP